MQSITVFPDGGDNTRYEYFKNMRENMRKNSDHRRGVVVKGDDSGPSSEKR